MENEIWKDVIGYEGRYQVSSLGRVKSLARIKYAKNNGIQQVPEKILIGHTERYRALSLCNGRSPRPKLVHRLVAQAFIPNPENKPSINHINGIKTDNRVENLEWCTQKENCVHAFKTGLSKPLKGENAPGAKLKTSDVIEIKRLAALGIDDTTIGKQFNVARTAISRIRNRKRWAHLD